MMTFAITHVDRAGEIQVELIDAGSEASAALSFSRRFGLEIIEIERAA